MHNEQAENNLHFSDEITFYNQGEALDQKQSKPRGI